MIAHLVGSVQEYEIYLPAQRNDGARVADAAIERIKGKLTKAFGGYTHPKNRSEGAWRIAGVTFHDEVTILRVLDDGKANFDMSAFKRELAETLDQKSILIFSREICVI